MFGRRIAPPAPPFPPPPPPPARASGKLPIEPMRHALDGVIRQLSQALAGFDIDCGALGDATPATGDVRAALGDSLCFDDCGDPSFLTLYRTDNFRQIECIPHWRFFVMTSALGLARDIALMPDDRVLGERIARSEFTAPLLDAHMMKAWIDLIRPTGQAAAAADQDALLGIRKAMTEQMVRIGGKVPPRLLADTVVRSRIAEWCEGWPAVLTCPLTTTTRRINNVPMDDNADRAITARLAELQAQGLRANYDPRRASGQHPA